MSFGTVIQSIESEIVKEWGELEDEALQFASHLWDAVRPVLLGILPAQVQILKDLLHEAIEDIHTMNIEQIETALLNLAITEELAFLRDLESKAMQALIALFKPTAPAA